MWKGNLSRENFLYRLQLTELEQQTLDETGQEKSAKTTMYFCQHQSRWCVVISALSRWNPILMAKDKLTKVSSLLPNLNFNWTLKFHVIFFALSRSCDRFKLLSHATWFRIFFVFLLISCSRRWLLQRSAIYSMKVCKQRENKFYKQVSNSRDVELTERMWSGVDLNSVYNDQWTKQVRNFTLIVAWAFGKLLAVKIKSEIMWVSMAYKSATWSSRKSSEIPARN